MMRRHTGMLVAAGPAVAIVVIALGLAAAAPARSGHSLFPGGRGPLIAALGDATGAPPAGLDDIDSDTCVQCHADIGAEWRASMHRQSYSGAMFQAGYRLDRLEFCKNCHAPLAPAGRDAGGMAAAEGIACSVCHVREGRILARRVTAAGQRAHAMREEPLLGQSAYCAGCHEFAFPDATLVKRPAFDPHELMQGTFSEWQGSEAAARGQSCQDCHMPWQGSGAERHRSHAFPGLGDRDFVARGVALGVRAERRAGASIVHIDMDVSAVGHAFPTGDMYRQAELRVWPRGRPELEKRAVLGRFFGPGTVRTATGVQVLQRERRDTRLGPDAQGTRKSFRFRFAGAPAGPFEYRLEIVRMPDSLARRQGLDVADTRVLIHQGSVSPARRRVD